MNPYRPRRLMAVPPTLLARMEIAKAIGTLAAQEIDDHARRLAEIRAIRRDLEKIPELLRKAIGEYRASLRVELRKYSPDQPRVPAGNPDGGQWTKEGEGGGSPNATSANAPEIRSSSYPRYAMLDTSSGAMQTDASTPLVDSDNISVTPNEDGTPKPNPQLAGGLEEDESETRIGREPIEATLAQQIRLGAARARLQWQLSRVHRIDPSWNPTPGAYELSAEGEIRSAEDAAKEAEQYLLRLRQLALPRDPRTGELILSREAKTGDPFIDYTTEKLQDILDDVIDKIGPRRDFTPQQYGTRVHVDFAKAVRAAGLRGIAPEDVERTFGVEPDAPYGAEYSVRIDTLLRDDDGNIIVIYDPKTGRGMRQLHAIRIRLRTGSEATVPIIEIYPDRDPVWKLRRNKKSNTGF